MKKYLICLLSVLTLAFTANAQALKYMTSVPANGSNIKSLENLTLQFDFSEIYSSLGEDETGWGVCCNTYPKSEAFPEKEKTITLYEGDQETGVVLARIAETIKPPHEKFQPGNSITFEFSDIEINPDQLYTVVIKYIFYAGKVSATTWTTSTKLDCQANPLVLQFYGASETAKVLKYETSSIGENAIFEKLGNDIKLSFNYDVEVLTGASASVRENGVDVAAATRISVDTSDPKSILLSFPETTLYNGHQYTLTLPAGAVGVAGETDVVNSEVTVPFEGASFRYFGKGRVSPTSNRPNSPVTLDAVNIPFNFPEIEGSGFIYGFVNGHNEIPMKVYKGTEEYGELIATIKPSDGTNTSVSYNVSAVKVETGQQYTLVIEEGEVKAYAIGDPRNSYLKDYISEKVVLTYWTPTRESLPEFRLSVDNIDGNAPGVSYDHIEAVKFNITSPEYDYQTYSLISVNPTAYLYLVTGEEKQEIKRVIIDNRSANFDVDLYEGKTYRVEIPEGTYSIKDSEFLKRHVIQQELSYTIKGTHPLESDMEFASNIAEGQKVSHVGVVSFYTESGVTPAENASLEIRRDNQTVATSPLRVVQENGYSHIYADFSDADHRAFVTESGISYHAVLPKGTLIDASNTELHNREYSVAFSGLETAATATYHNVTLTIDNAVAQTSEVEEGRTLGYTFTPADELWKLESVDGAVLQDGEYVTAPVTADTEVKVRFAPAREVDFDFTTAIDGIIEGCSYRIYLDGTHLVIDGVSAGDRIRVYTTGGTLMADKTVPADMTTARLILESGIYIIAINETTLKVRH